MPYRKNPHDRYFHAAIFNSKVARELFSQFLQKTVQQYVDLTTLQLQNKTFIDKDFSKQVNGKRPGKRLLIHSRKIKTIEQPNRVKMKLLHHQKLTTRC